MKCDLQRQAVSYKGKDGKEHHSFDYYLVFENGEVIQIMPKWTKDSNDFIKLRALSNVREYL